MSFKRIFGTIAAIALCLGLAGCATELTPVEARAKYDRVYADKGPRVKLDALSDPSHPVDPALRARWGFLADLPGKTFINRGFDSPILLTVEWQEKGKSMVFASRTLQGKHWDITSDVIVYSEALQRLHLSKHGPTGFPQANGAIVFAGGPFSEFMLVPTVSGLFFVADVWQYLFVPYSKAKEEEFLVSIRNKGEGTPLHIGIDKRVDGPELPPPTVLAVVRPQAQTHPKYASPLSAPKLSTITWPAYVAASTSPPKLARWTTSALAAVSRRGRSSWSRSTCTTRPIVLAGLRPAECSNAMSATGCLVANRTCCRPIFPARRKT